MLYILYGTDRNKRRARLRTLLSKHTGGDAPPERIDAEELTPAILEELLGRTALFGVVPPVIFDDVCADERSRDMICARAKDLASSENFFVLVEEKIPAETLKALKKHTASIEEFSSKEAKSYKQKTGFNIFSLTDALGQRDRKRAWVLYRQALAEGMAPEEVHSMLFWQTKTMCMVAGAKNVKGLPLKPFVVTKARGFTKNYTQEELLQLSGALVSLYHDAHRGVVEFETGLERLLLSL